MEYVISSKKLRERLLASVAPEMPRNLCPVIKLTISKVPAYMRPAAANAMFPAMAAHLNNIKFPYLSNVECEPICMEVTCGSSSIGKSFVDPMIEAIIRKLREHDVTSRHKLEEYARDYKRKGANKEKPERPKDVAILVPEPDMTNPALVQLLMDAQEEGNLPIYTQITEIDMLDQAAGGHRKVTKVIRLNSEAKRYGQQRATVDGITGNPFLRWQFNASCTEIKAKAFFRDCLLDGTLGRIGFSYIANQGNQRGIPKQGNYDQAYLDELDVFLQRLHTTHGIVRVPMLDSVIRRLEKELEEIIELSGDKNFASLAWRSLGIAWLKGCIIYVAEGQRWSKEIANFVEWSLAYDLWSKLQLFSDLIREKGFAKTSDVRKTGPVNMLNLLPDSGFTKAQYEALRQQRGMTADGGNQLYVWKTRGYVELDPEHPDIYRKTEAYRKRHG